VLAREVGPLGVKVTIVEPGGFRTDFAGTSTTLLSEPPGAEQGSGLSGREAADIVTAAGRPLGGFVQQNVLADLLDGVQRP